MIHGKPLHHAIHTATLGAVLAGGLVLSASAMAAPQGLYSADELMDADVYSTAGTAQIGEVEDILLDNDMTVRALVVDTGSLLDLKGNQQFVVEAGKFTVETHNGNSLEEIEYQVNIDLSEAELVQQPAYTNDWWQNARQGAQQAWENTKEGAASAWESTQEGASRALDRIGQALENVGEKTQDAANQ
ncbi:PRC-barrel domain-containing protein [Halomonas saccharevitans]|uniref:PRC-barrel domain-containing protein n=1 Tax=Halomonas saccharevitans TaxID=416872 RepID=A0ABU3NI78_9GAMM|nr:PRC-barrel domain-containing protein [Halomonas saccharevitans]MDT8880290.1 PRC-barrel domain-containing protein [Halomonas saccharevitans]